MKLLSEVTDHSSSIINDISKPVCKEKERKLKRRLSILEEALYRAHVAAFFSREIWAWIWTRKGIGKTWVSGNVQKPS